MTPPTVALVKHSTIFGVVYAWLAAHVFNHVPSPVLEIISGLLLVALVVFVVTLLHGWIAVAALATAGSLAYELKLDPNGFSWGDVTWREVGIAVAVGVAVLLALI
jgi:hypothetical protein